MPSTSRLARAWNGFFYSGFSGESLGLLRIAIGVGLIPFHISQFYSFFEISPTGPGFHYLEPMWHFRLLGILQDVPWLDWLVFALLMAATVSMIVGRWTRSSILLVILCIFFLKGARDSYTGDVHHRYLMPVQVLFFLLLSKCGSRHSLDARRKGAQPVAEWEASWPIKAIQLYICSFYLWSILAKLRIAGWAWFEGGLRLQQLLLSRSVMWGIGPDGVPLQNQWGFYLAHETTLLVVLTWLTFALEFGFPLLLFVRDAKLRLFLLLGVTGFHLVNFAVLYVGFVFLPIVFFVFFDLVPVWDWLRGRWSRLRAGPVPG